MFEVATTNTSVFLRYLWYQTKHVTQSTQLLFIGDKSFCVAVSSYMFRPVYRTRHQAKHSKTVSSNIYLLTAIGLSPGGSSTVHIYTQTIHRTTQNKQYIEQHNNLGERGPCPVLARSTLAFALQLRKMYVV